MRSQYAVVQRAKCVGQPPTQAVGEPGRFFILPSLWTVHPQFVRPVDGHVLGAWTIQALGDACLVEKVQDQRVFGQSLFLRHEYSLAVLENR
ncbi:hypothetical protein ALP29_200128 [Pseudomonas syringae pv. avii]|uniref:Uncharacterized protein n=1 Tax=Pseudomonas syringae pv. avii TaxID=663959 RepID=A0A3M5VPM4_PSESX|nr:hypothetical protein ALP29_200128 [Pseudomonas syringae pv. avii]